MALRETQALLACIFTDAKARREFLEDPQRVARARGLSEIEAATMAALDRREVEDFARSLLGKRALDARKTLPLTAKALGKKFDALLYEAIEAAPQPQRRRADAAALARLLASRPMDPPWISDLARYEMGFVAAARAGGFFLMRRFAWPMDDIARQLLAGARVDVSPRQRVGLWLRAPRGRLFFRLF
ncbi:hypothetical protein OGR47_08035 [Methylocystis sp. MJC1]|jgi:hypothetical protein|uniref:hypothetical protein n=1 Tax=Methylocystis sp. MJC1 TaxID=2654282 RepID=UPI0013ED641F|nr:hypothetical protein [Methylocystis sp. MJC1]KAF2989209.1 hypothetical protein MJC1_03682 [Methylocystis sp. MJC1]MBU6526936.1 hypothetical protein [Methylocystis sp. MJC1]UZX13373.1 hypothetical protein OGR47_08035 [Methylocystis sp. MJC1]